MLEEKDNLRFISNERMKERVKKKNDFFNEKKKKEIMKNEK